jgi:hypothetical protein
VTPPETGEIEPAPGFAEMLLQRLFRLVRDMKGRQQQSS